MNVLLFQLDGKLPNVACMRIAAHHRDRGNSVEFRWSGSPNRELWDNPDVVYGSAIFNKTKPAIESLLQNFPAAIVGGTGVDVKSNLEARGITTIRQDYSLYPTWKSSIGFSQRGCRLNCEFCCVRKKEGAWRSEQSIQSVWRGEPWPRELILLDNDFFGNEPGKPPIWPQQIKEIRDGRFKVSFAQGINARFLTDEAAEAVASIDYRDVSMNSKRIYTAWDNRNDEERLMAGLNRLVKYGVKPDHIMVYILVGFWPGETEADRLYRWKKLRDFGARPYPMPFVRTQELVGFQRWIVGAYDKRFTWDEWKSADYRPEKLNQQAA